MVPLVLCADDYAMTPAVSRGILALLETGRITATGAMTNRPSWPEAAPALRAFAGKADLGVHLSLTCGEALTAGEGWTASRAQPKLPALLARAVAGALPLDAIMREIEAQLDAFEQAMGMCPDFIDGHQHVHALPGIRRALLAVLARRYPGREPWIRDPGDRLAAIRARGRFARKARLLALLAGPFGRRMAEAGFRLNQGFAGYSAFDPAGDYGGDFASYLVAPGPAHLVMCHPGEVDDALRTLDPATESRLTELAFFRSDRFSETCAAAGMRLARMEG
ncbi:MAG: ChbG/HpnK family deacetylase [Rhabdaerophilum sp.]